MEPTEDRSYEQIVNRFYRIAVSGRGLHALIDEASEVFETILWLTDLNYRVLVAGNKRDYGIPHLQYDLKHHPYLSEPILRVLMEYLNRIRNTVTESFVRVPFTLVNFNILVYPIRIRGIPVALLNVCEQEPFSEEQMAMLQELVRIIAWFQQSSFTVTRTSSAASALLQDILDGKGMQIGNPDSRFLALGIPRSEQLQLLTICPEKEEIVGSAEMDFLAGGIQNVLTDSICAIRDHALVVLLNDQNLFSETAVYLPELTQFLQDTDCLCGISNAVHSASQLDRTYLQAAFSVQFGRKLQPSQRIYSYRDYFLYHLLISGMDALSLSSEIEKFFQPIWDYEHERRGKLTETLILLVQEDFQTIAAAQKLGIHKNTMLQRLEKIKSLTGNSLEGSLAQAKLTLMILYLRMEDAGLI